MHPLLAHQVKKTLGVDDPNYPKLRALLQAVSESYEAADADRRLLEHSVALASGELHEQHRKLADDLEQRRRLERELRQGEKLRAVGQLAAGIAHEINTPIQFVGDSIHFLAEGFQDVLQLFESYGELCAALEAGEATDEKLRAVRSMEAEVDLEDLTEQFGRAFERIVDGIQRVAEIVRAMKEFAHTDQREIVLADLNRAIQNTLAVARNELKHVAEVQLELGDLPLVECHPGELNQVFLNLLVNAAHAVRERYGADPTRGIIGVRSTCVADEVLITIWDNGPGIPPAIVERVFEPFFTTKGLGKGTGQGLPLAQAIVVERHRGQLTFDTEVGAGTSFHVRLPVHAARRASDRTVQSCVSDAVPA